MTRFILAVSASLLAGLLYGEDDVGKEKWPERIAILKTAREYTTKEGDFVVVVTTPESKNLRAMGGSGGPMMQLLVERTSDGKKMEFHQQVVCAVVLPNWNNFPQYEIWGRGGGGYWSRGLFRYVNGEYKAVRYDQFEECPRHQNQEAETVTPPFRPHGEGDDTGMRLYFIESIIPSP